jgi:DNA-nicking Smr family endonuclease
MKRAGRKTGSGSRSLTPDEAALWHHATRSLDKVEAKQRVTPEPEQQDPAPTAGKHQARSTMQVDRASEATQRRPRAEVAKNPPAMADFDRRQARRIATGKSEVEARIDLHGLRQRDAHARLRAFLFDAHARGLKTVLVITGKGGSEAADAARDLADDRQRGVLRRSVPHWLREHDVQSIVVSFTQAGVRHGGAGALYVRLRRRDRPE